jgi:hypothetical protein
MSHAMVGLTALALLFAASTQAAEKKCRLKEIADLPVTMSALDR